MGAADFVAIALAAVTTVSGFLAILETIFAPQTKRARKLWIIVFGSTVIIAIILVIIQQHYAAVERNAAEKQMNRLSHSADSANRQLSQIEGQIKNLAKLTQGKVNEPPEKVLAAVAAKILELEKTSRTQQKQINALQPRHLSQVEKTKLYEAARKLCPFKSNIPVTAALGNQEAQAYGEEFVKILKAAGCSADLALPVPGLRPDILGIAIAVRSTSHPGNDAESLAKILASASIPFRIGLMEPNFFAGSRFVLVIGANKN